jgi:hypothetical protein
VTTLIQRQQAQQQAHGHVGRNGMEEKQNKRCLCSMKCSKLYASSTNETGVQRSGKQIEANSTFALGQEGCKNQ